MSGEIFFLILHTESNKKGKLFQIKKIKSWPKRETFFFFKIKKLSKTNKITKHTYIISNRKWYK